MIKCNLICLFIYLELGSHYVTLAGLDVVLADLKLVVVLLTLSGKCWYYRWVPLPQLACSHAKQENKTKTQHHFQTLNLCICKIECSEIHGEVDVGLYMLRQVQLSLRIGCNLDVAPVQISSTIKLTLLDHMFKFSEKEQLPLQTCSDFMEVWQEVKTREFGKPQRLFSRQAWCHYQQWLRILH